MTNESQTILGRKLLMLRKVNNVPVAELMNLLNIKSDATIHAIEDGRKTLYPDQILKLANFYNIDPTLLLDCKRNIIITDYLEDGEEKISLEDTKESYLLIQFIKNRHKISKKAFNAICYLAEELRNRTNDSHIVNMDKKK